VGVLTQTGLIEGLTTRGINGKVSEVMTQEYKAAESNEMLESVFVRMQSGKCDSFTILSAGKLIAIVTLENGCELILVQVGVGTSMGSLRTRQIFNAKPIL
jgi:predicted transcriptional regulator